MRNLKQLAVQSISILLLLVSFYLGPSLNVIEASTSTLPQNITKKLDTSFSNMIGDTGEKIPGLGVLAVKNGKVVYSDFLGRRYIDKDNRQKDLPLTKDTRFRIASISKMFTGLAFMQLVEEGKINLDEDVSKYLGFKLINPSFPTVIITPRMLLSHTSSLRDGKMYSIPPQYSVKEFFIPNGVFYNNGEHFAKADQPPVEYFQYTNLNYGLLATIMEKITGERFDIYMRTHLLKQLDIKGSYNISDFTGIELKQVGTIYQKQTDDKWDDKGPWIPQIDDLQGKKPPSKDSVYISNPDVREYDKFYRLKDYKIGTNATVFSPQGGLHVSTMELQHLLQLMCDKGVYRGKRIIKAETLAEMWRPQWIYDPVKNNGNTYGGDMTMYGLAVQPIAGMGTARFLVNRNVEMVGHFADAYGLVAGIFVEPNKPNGFIYLMNGMATSENDNSGHYSGMYHWEEKFTTAILDNIFPEMGIKANTSRSIS